MPFEHAAPAETEDPKVALSDRSIHTRCAAARDLSRYGTPDDIPLLVTGAQTDRSPAVRLGTAGAVADILSRYRVGPRRAELDDDQRRALFDKFKGIDPSVNAGLFSMLACIGLPEGFRRITVGLRDPRGDVRLGAAIGLLRHCSSAAAHGDEAMEASVVELIRDARLKPDALAEVAWVAARVGFRSARSAIGGLSLSGAQAELRDKAIDQIAAYDEPLMGAWEADGRDAGEVNPHPALPTGIAVFSEHGAIIGDGDDVSSWAFTDGVLPGAIRRMFIRRVGDAEPAEAFQFDGRTWYGSSPERVDAIVQAIARPDSLTWKPRRRPSPVEKHAVAVLSPMLSDDATGDMQRGLLLARAGDIEGATEALRASADAAKKVPNEARYYLAKLLVVHGDSDGAKPYVQAFLKKSKKKDPLREAAEALL